MIVKDINILKQESRETFFGECKELNIFDKLKEELFASPRAGYALAAIQINVPIKAVYIGTERTKFEIRAMNPRIIEYKEPFVHPNEGCLSLLSGISVNRYREVLVEYIDYDSGETKKQWQDGLMALIWQHEIDHVNGITILDREYKTDSTGRNDPCPCGSGKKYKKCCMK